MPTAASSIIHLQLELQTLVNHLTWVLGTEPRTSRRASSAPNCGVISYLSSWPPTSLPFPCYHCFCPVSSYIVSPDKIQVREHSKPCMRYDILFAHPSPLPVRLTAPQPLTPPIHPPSSQCFLSSFCVVGFVIKLRTGTGPWDNRNLSKQKPKNLSNSKNTKPSLKDF